MFYYYVHRHSNSQLVLINYFWFINAACSSPFCFSDDNIWDKSLSNFSLKLHFWSILSTFTIKLCSPELCIHIVKKNKDPSVCKICFWHNMILGIQDYSSLHSPWPMLIWMWNSFNFTFSICGLSYGFHFCCGDRSWRGFKSVFEGNIFLFYTMKRYLSEFSSFFTYVS